MSSATRSQPAQKINRSAAAPGPPAAATCSSAAPGAAVVSVGGSSGGPSAESPSPPQPAISRAMIRHSVAAATRRGMLSNNAAGRRALTATSGRQRRLMRKRQRDRGRGSPPGSTATTANRCRAQRRVALSRYATELGPHSSQGRRSNRQRKATAGLAAANENPTRACRLATTSRRGGLPVSRTSEPASTGGSVVGGCDPPSETTAGAEALPLDVDGDHRHRAGAVRQGAPRDPPVHSPVLDVEHLALGDAEVQLGDPASPEVVPPADGPDRKVVVGRSVDLPGSGCGVERRRGRVDVPGRGRGPDHIGVRGVLRGSEPAAVVVVREAAAHPELAHCGELGLDVAGRSRVVVRRLEGTGVDPGER